MQRKGVLPGKIFARCIPKRLFAGLFGCMARISCQSQLISDAWRANLAANWRFSRPRPLSGCMERKSCHGLTPGERTAAESCRGKALGNASREYIATASRAKSALGRNPTTVGRWETHFASILPSSSARETHIRNVLPTERHLRAGGAVYMRKGRDVLRMETTHCRDGWQPNGR